MTIRKSLLASGSLWEISALVWDTVAMGLALLLQESRWPGAVGHEMTVLTRKTGWKSAVSGHRSHSPQWIPTPTPALTPTPTPRLGGQPPGGRGRRGGRGSPWCPRSNAG